MSEYIGEIGKRIDVTVKLKNEYSYTDYNFSYYGTTHYIYTFVDENENVYVWKTTSLMCTELYDGDRQIGNYFPRKGDTLKLKGTVKEHSEYEDVKQTVLNRCKYEVLEMAPTQEEIESKKREEQLKTLKEKDFIWRMKYSQYKNHYSDCETVIGSYESGLNGNCIRVDDATIEVIIRDGRLKNSGVRGKTFKHFKFEIENDREAYYRAVDLEHAVKQLLKEFPNCENYKHIDTLY